MPSTIFENEFIRQGILLGNEFAAPVPSLSAGNGMQVADTIRGILETNGWGQGQLAKAIRTSQGTISKWLSNQQTPE
jgi:hypothetical protein